MCNNHLSLEERLITEREIGIGKLFKYIYKDCTITFEEIRNHFKVKKTKGYGRFFYNCIYRNEFKIYSLCDNCYFL